MNKAMKLKLPKKMTPEFAEFLGILIGDGSVYDFTDPKNKRRRLIEIVGHSINDRAHFESKIIPLFKVLFNMNVTLFQRNDQNVIFVRCQSKGLFNFLKDVGMNIGPKNDIKIPEIILKNKKFIVPFVRGLYDTDGSLALKKRHKKYKYYPTITMKLKSETIIQQVAFELNCLGFSFCRYVDIVDDGTGKKHVGYKIDLNGKRNLEKWMKLIGFNNPKHLLKVARCRDIYAKGKVQLYSESIIKKQVGRVRVSR
ncbi:MAG: hypothetical protein ISS93_00330 [Candidatus Aenigmarchaeota archaeon]|nr:hypothetical protein [Candidatus Aenigmarchaeota archaeon]